MDWIAVPKRARITFASLLALGLLAVSISLPAVACAGPAHKRATLAIDATQTIVAASAKYDVMRISSKSSPSHLGTRQRSFRFRIGSRKSPRGVLTLTLRRLPSGSLMLFARVDASKPGAAVSVSVRTGSTTSVLHELGLKPDLTYSKVVGIDRTSGPIGWVSFSGGDAAQSSVLLSRAYQFKTLTKRYDAAHTSTVRTLTKEARWASRKSVGGRAAVSVDLWAPTHQACERWLLVMPYAISPSLTGQDSILPACRESRWLSPTASYAKAPYSIAPETKIGYVRSLVNMRNGNALTIYNRTKSPIMRDLLMSNLYTLANTRPKDGLWKTDYTSTWVQKESGIVAPYTDTRNNELIALSSLDAAESLISDGVTQAVEATSWAPSYGQFLLGREAAGQYAALGSDGVFFGDYYGSNGRLTVHTSLNHALGEMNYLFRMYDETSSTACLGLAKRIKHAVDATGLNWIRPSGDLWYQRNLNGTYQGTDYRTVTYDDLHHSVTNFDRFLHSTDPTFQALIDSKARFLGYESSGEDAGSDSAGEY